MRHLHRHHPWSARQDADRLIVVKVDLNSPHMRQGMEWGSRQPMRTPFVLPAAHRHAQRQMAAGPETSSVEALSSLTASLCSGHLAAAQIQQRDIEQIAQPLRSAIDPVVAALSRQVASAVDAYKRSTQLEAVLEADRRRWQSLTAQVSASCGLLSAVAKVEQQAARTIQGLAYTPFGTSTPYGCSEADPADDLDDAGDVAEVNDASSASRLRQPAQPKRLHRISSPMLAVGAHHFFGRPDSSDQPAQAGQLAQHFESFLENEDVGADPREGIAGLIAWTKFKGGGSAESEGREFNRLIRLFLRGELPLQKPAEVLSTAGSDLLNPLRSSSAPSPELVGEALTSNQLARLLAYDDSTLRREASRALQRGPLPQPLKCAPGWYVVDGPSSSGGRKRGWKFMKSVA